MTDLSINLLYDEHPVLERILLDLDDNASQENMWRLIIQLQKEIQEHKRFLVPLIDQTLDEMMAIEPLDLDHLDGSVHELFRLVELEKGGYAYCAFTSEAELEKGSESSYEKVEAARLFETAFSQEDVVGIVINPWGLSVLIDKNLLSLIFEEDRPQRDSSSLYVDRGETCQQQADALVCAGYHPLAFDEPCSKAMFEESDGKLADEVRRVLKYRTDEGSILTCSAPGLKADAVYFVTLPAKCTERNLSSLICDVLDQAERDQMHSIALPAIGCEEGNLNEPLPFAVIAAAGWLSAHPQTHLDITITCRKKSTYDLFYSYLFS